MKECSNLNYILQRSINIKQTSLDSLREEKKWYGYVQSATLVTLTSKKIVFIVVALNQKKMIF